MTSFRPLFFLLVACCLVCAAAAAPLGPDAPRLVKEGQELYRQGRLGDALLKFEEAIEAGAADGELFYQVGYCYRVVREDLVKSREYMARAAPLLEKAASETPASLYYLGTIYALELGNMPKGQEVARRAVALAEQGAFARWTDGESCFQIGRLFSLAGEKGKAIGWYQKAVAAVEAGGGSSDLLKQALDHMAKDSVATSEWPRAVDAFTRLLLLDPGDEDLRMSASAAMVSAGRYQDAAATLRYPFLQDDLATEANFAARILTRHQELGAPAAPEGIGKLEDSKLQDAILNAARKLSEIRQKEEPPAQATPEEPPYRTVKGKNGKMIKIYEPYMKPPPEDWQPKDPNNPTPAEHRRLLGYPPPPENPAPSPPSAERLAAEKEFFGLLMEVLRRGRSVRDSALAAGYASLIFR